MLFRGEYDFLSNMYILPDGKSAEHYFQAMKCVSRDDALRIMACVSPTEAKKLGRRVEMRDDWHEVRDGFMLASLRYKFSTFPHLAEKLLATAPIELVEENWWGDKYWGVSNGIGENVLGKLLMMVRDELADK
jgi:ribA/ribD-fused uncharacterized protein